MPQGKARAHRSGWQRRKRARPDEILAAAAAVFSRKGYAARMADIAAVAGITKGTIYLYFAGKDDLFAHAVPPPPPRRSKISTP